jgi:hypothetical protein
MTVLGAVLFALGLGLFRRVRTSLMIDPLVRAEYERNPWWPYYTLRLFALGMMVAGLVIAWRTL